MMTIPQRSLPTVFCSDLASLQIALSNSKQVVFDFETEGLDPRKAIPCGLGFYFPETGEAWYINVGHRVKDLSIPLLSPGNLSKVLTGFFGNPNCHAIAHNATFDLRFLMQIKVTIRCRVSCTMVMAHRVDENLVERNNTYSFHDRLKVGYGLKDLTALLFGTSPPTLQEVIGKTNTMFAPPMQVAQYCVADTYNTWQIYQHCLSVMEFDFSLKKLIKEIDDPNHTVIAKMLWDGIPIDRMEIEKQRADYENAIAACRQTIWDQIGCHPHVDTPNQLKKLLELIGIANVAFSDLPVGVAEHMELSVRTEEMQSYFMQATTKKQQIVLASVLAMRQMKYRVSSFLHPFVDKVSKDSRLRPSYFSSLLVTTRFSSTPNVQNLPGKSDKAGEHWRQMLSSGTDVHHKTRRIFAAEPGSVFVQADFKAAEPRYLAMLFERGLSLKDSQLAKKKKLLDAKRWKQYPDLMQLKKDTAKPYQARKSKVINFPKLNHDPLWETFANGDDPYNALLKAMMPTEHSSAVCSNLEDDWFKQNRAIGKRAFLALGYGSTPSALAPQLGWSVEKTTLAIETMKQHYQMLEPLTELTKQEVIRLGEVRTLWDRPRRMNGFYQFAGLEPLTIKYCLAKPTYREYRMDIIPLGSTAYGTQAFVRRVVRDMGNGKWELIWDADENGTIKHLDQQDTFVRNVKSGHFNNPPFANLSHRCIRWVKDSYGIHRELPRLEDAVRQAFNSMCQSTGADHLRKAMNDVDRELLSTSQFDDVKLVLTVHDSLVFEVPEEKAVCFARRAATLLSQRPAWSTIDFPVEVEIGPNLGDLVDETSYRASIV